MTQINSNTFKTNTATLYPTNGIGLITATDLREQMDNIADSLVFVTTGKIAPPTINDDEADTSGNGIFAVSHVWVDETNDESYMCVDATAGAAVWWPMTTLSAAKLISILDGYYGDNNWANTNYLPLTGGELSGNLTMGNGTTIILESPDGLSNTIISTDNNGTYLVNGVNPNLLLPITVSASRNITLADVGYHLFIDSSGGAVNLTIPANSDPAVDVPIGAMIPMTIVDNTSDITLTAGTGNTLNTVALGVATLTPTVGASISYAKRTATENWITGAFDGIA